MAQFNDILKGRHALLYKGDGADPEVFTKSCLFHNGISHTSTRNETTTPTRAYNCLAGGDPDAPAVIKTDTVSIQDTLAGEFHFLTEELYDEVMAAHYDSTIDNYELRVHEPAIDGTIGDLYATFAFPAKFMFSNVNYPGDGSAVCNGTLTAQKIPTYTKAP